MQCESNQRCTDRMFDEGSTAVCTETDEGNCLNGQFEEHCLSDSQAKICQTLDGPNYDHVAETNRGVITVQTCEAGSTCRMDQSGFAGCWLDE